MAMPGMLDMDKSATRMALSLACSHLNKMGALRKSRKAPSSIIYF